MKCPYRRCIRARDNTPRNPCLFALRPQHKVAVIVGVHISAAPATVLPRPNPFQELCLRRYGCPPKGFTINGTTNSANEVDSYLNKGVYVLGGGNDDPLDGFTMLDMGIHNCGGECVRLKSGVRNAEVSGNTITNCGIYYYRFGKGNNNGEGIYIGTSASQLDDLESPDQCTNIIVAGNDIATNGNECVDIKEGASGNVVTDNTCSWQLDKMSAGFNIRGNDNTVQDNKVENCQGCGVRLGGWTVQGTQYGVNNSVCGNEFKNTGGLFNIRIFPQSEICGNSCVEGDCSFEYNWKYKEDVEDIKSTWDNSCG